MKSHNLPIQHETLLDQSDREALHRSSASKAGEGDNAPKYATKDLFHRAETSNTLRLPGKKRGISIADKYEVIFKHSQIFLSPRKTMGADSARTTLSRRRSKQRA